MLTLGVSLTLTLRQFRVRGKERVRRRQRRRREEVLRVKGVRCGGVRSSWLALFAGWPFHLKTGT